MRAPILPSLAKRARERTRAEPLSPEIQAWRKQQRDNDLLLVAYAAVSDGVEPTQARREHAAMARCILAIEAERESRAEP